MGISENGRLLSMLSGQREEEQRTSLRLANRLQINMDKIASLLREKSQLCAQLMESQQRINAYDTTIALLKSQESADCPYCHGTGDHYGRGYLDCVHCGVAEAKARAGRAAS